MTKELAAVGRREFLGKLGAGVLGTSLITCSEFGSNPRPAAPSGEWIMMIWCAHSISAAQRLHSKFDREYVRQMMAHCADHDIHSIIWRGGYVGKVTYHSKVGEMMRRLEPDYFERQGLNWEPTLMSFNGMADAVSVFDTLDTAIAEAKSRKIEFYADIQPFDRYFPGLENKFFDEHPQYWLLARDQKKYYRGIPCIAERETQDYILREVRELLERGVDGISISLGSHAGGLEQFGAGGKAADEYGFNPSIVSTYKQRYGVNILKEEYDLSKLYALNGELFTSFLRRVRQLVGSKRKIICSTMLDGYTGYGGKGGEQLGKRRWVRQEPIEIMPAYRINLEWEKWMSEDIADALMVYAPMPTAVEQIQRIIKSKLKKSPVLLIRETDDRKFEQEYRKEFAAIRTGALDGIVIDEMKDYHPHPQYWCKLLQ